MQRFDARLVNDTCGNKDVLMKEAFDGLFVRYEDVEAELAKLRLENDRLKALLSRWRNTHSCDSVKGYVCAVCEDSDAILGTQATQKGSE